MAQKEKKKPVTKNTAETVKSTVEFVDEDELFEEVKVKTRRKKKRKAKKDYPKLPERELRRQLRSIEQRARIRLSMILVGLLSIGLAILGRYTLSIISLIGFVIATFGIIYSLFAFIRVKNVKWYFIVAGIIISGVGIALSYRDLIGFIASIDDVIDIIRNLLDNFI